MHLSDCFIPLMACVAYALPEAERNQASYEELRTSIMAHVDACARHPARSEFSEGDFEAARFAVFCWVDDRVMQSGWNGKAQWQKEALQRVHFKTAQGGAEFFTRLKETDPSRREVYEVFYLCLMAGFRGRYGMEGDEQTLDDLKAGLCRRLVSDDERLTSDGREKWFPAPYTGEMPVGMESQAKSGSSLMSFLLVLSPAVLCGILFVIYGFILNSEVLTGLVR